MRPLLRLVVDSEPDEPELRLVEDTDPELDRWVLGRLAKLLARIELRGEDSD